MSTKKQSDPRGFFLIWAILGLTFVLLSSHITSSQYARFVSQASGSDGARVIKFGQLEIKEEGPTSNVFAPGVPIKKDFAVTFGGSEASTIVFIAVDAPDWNLSNGGKTFTDSKDQLYWSVADYWTFLTSEGDTHIYYKSLNPNEVLNQKGFVAGNVINVEFSAEKLPEGTAGAVPFYNNYPSTSFTVKGYVVQSNKFDNAQAAWNSLTRKN
jgi:hypothetical protein